MSDQDAAQESVEPKPAIAFIGMGIMGRCMARNLLKAGYAVTVWNRTHSKSDELVADGAQVADSIAEAAAASDIIILCVSDTPDVEAVVLGDDGVLAGAKAGALLIDCSTISPGATRTIAEKCAAQGVAMLDAPVSGGSEGAAKGTLSIMVGGDAADFERALPVLQAMGKNIVHVGDHGAGQTVKLVNQVLVVGNCLAMCEALLLAQGGGVDLQKTFDAISQGAAGSWMFTNRAPQIMRRDWRPGFTVDLQQKDLRLVLEAADEIGVPLPGTSLIFQFYRTLQQQGLGSEGNHALVKALENLAQLQVGRGERIMSNDAVEAYGWGNSAEAWIADQGDHGDYARQFVLDAPMLERVRAGGSFPRANPAVTFATALDVGCGEGRFPRILNGMGIKTTGMDIVPAFVEAAKQRDPQGDYVVGNAEALDFADDSFDLVVSYVTLLDIPDIRRAIPEMVRVLRPGGSLLLANLSSHTSAGGWEEQLDGSRKYVIDNYLDEIGTWQSWHDINVFNWHRPLSLYMQLFLNEGLILRYFDEPKARGGDPEWAARQQRVAWFVIMEWEKPVLR